MKKRLSIFAALLLLVPLFVIGGTDPSNTFRLGNGAESNKNIIFNRGSNNPQIRWNETTDTIQLTNDGSTYFDILVTGAVMKQVTLPYSGAASGDTTPVSGSAPNWTFTTPTGITRLIVCGRGGGGGGGGAGNGSAGGIYGGFGGGGAATACFPLVVSASTGYSVTIGAGGTAGTAGNSSANNPGGNGGNGSDSTFDSLLTFKGAMGGWGGGQDAGDVFAYRQWAALQHLRGAGVVGGHGGYGNTNSSGTFYQVTGAGQRSPFAAGGASGTGSVGDFLYVGGGGGGGDGVGGAGGNASTLGTCSGHTAGSAGTDGGGGGGGGGNNAAACALTAGGAGGNGAVRVIWTQ